MSYFLLYMTEDGLEVKAFANLTDATGWIERNYHGSSIPPKFLSGIPIGLTNNFLGENMGENGRVNNLILIEGRAVILEAAKVVTEWKIE